jgi:hypothetical protein
MIAMFTAAFYFLGMAVFVLAASICLSNGRRAGQHVEVDLADLRVASVGLLTTGRKPSWDEIRALWMKWYARCQEKAIVKQKAIYSWARTLALCAVLCLVGVLLEAEFDETISVSRVLAGFRHPYPVATDCHTPQSDGESLGHQNALAR